MLKRSDISRIWRSSEGSCDMPTHCNALKCTATHCCNTMCYTAIYCNILQHTATYCNTISCSSGGSRHIRLNELKHTEIHCCNTMCYTATYCVILQHTATYCSTEPLPQKKHHFVTATWEITNTYTKIHIHNNPKKNAAPCKFDIGNHTHAHKHAKT